MKQLIAFLFGLMVFSSCGKHLKNIAKNDTHVKTETKSETEITDKSITVTTETGDSLFVLPAIVVENTIDPEIDTADADSVITKETTLDGLTLTTKYDKKKKTYSATAKKDSTNLHLQVNKTTVQQNDIKIKQSTESKTDSSSKIKIKDTSHNYSAPNWTLIIIVIVVVIIGLFWFFGFPKKKKIDPSEVGTGSTYAAHQNNFTHEKD